ncbi:NUDIX domain-containing protein [Cognatishimia sp. SS12]|uniref:NUDIX domain-containing protein n=1 Tax=Cognatishimia sp. SS12 TaxID=2979465 RepID=UPI00232D52D8|nr:NUDIX domain-containing protein [Cognatishimia sp. SS12]MDC0737225.1 NUDIX domain-containing protein [Cognatishimia sp. SS12]
MSTLFFYGTLRHLPLLEIVLGRSVSPSEIAAASLDGYAALALADADYPVLIPVQGARAEGLLLKGVSEADMQRLAFYEGGYSLAPVDVTTAHGPQRAEAFLPNQSEPTTEGPWDFGNWRASHAPRAVFAAEEEMSYFGQIDAATLAMRAPMIRVRAAAKVNAMMRNDAFSPSGFRRTDTEAIGLTRPFTNFFSVETHEVAFRQYDGAMSAPVSREVFAASDASIVLPYDPRRDRVLLIEQFRPGPYARGDEKPWMLEPIAGRVDPGETPEETAHREAREEAGLSLSKLHSVARCYASPGCSTEYFNIFVGEADLPDDVTGVAGLDAEAEDIKSYLYSFDRLMEMVEGFEAANAPLVLAALWLARSRDRLRAVA